MTSKIHRVPLYDPHTVNGDSVGSVTMPLRAMCNIVHAEATAGVGLQLFPGLLDLHVGVEGILTILPNSTY